MQPGDKEAKAGARRSRAPARLPWEGARQRAGGPRPPAEDACACKRESVQWNVRTTRHHFCFMGACRLVLMGTTGAGLLDGIHAEDLRLYKVLLVLSGLVCALHEWRGDLSLEHFGLCANGRLARLHALLHFCVHFIVRLFFRPTSTFSVVMNFVSIVFRPKIGRNTLQWLDWIQFL